MEKQKELENNKKEFKKASGITLIALVITIVVLIVLGTVSITLTIRNGGIFGAAETAKQMQEMTAIKEEADLVKNELITKKYTEGAEVNKATLLTALKDHFNGTIEGDKVIVNNGKYEIVVDDNLNMTVQKTEEGTGGGEGPGPEDSENPEVALKIMHSIEPIDKSSKVIKIGYAYEGTTEISATKLVKDFCGFFFFYTI